MKTIKKKYRWMVLNSEENFWEPWTGVFKSEHEAEVWYVEHGQFHADNNHALGLFYGNQIIVSAVGPEAPIGSPALYDKGKYELHYRELRKKIKLVN